MLQHLFVRWPTMSRRDPEVVKHVVLLEEVRNEFAGVVRGRSIEVIVGPLPYEFGADRDLSVRRGRARNHHNNENRSGPRDWPRRHEGTKEKPK